MPTYLRVLRATGDSDRRVFRRATAATQSSVVVYVRVTLPHKQRDVHVLFGDHVCRISGAIGLAIALNFTENAFIVAGPDKTNRKAIAECGVYSICWPIGGQLLAFAVRGWRLMLPLSILMPFLRARQCQILRRSIAMAAF